MLDAGCFAYKENKVANFMFQLPTQLTEGDAFGLKSGIAFDGVISSSQFCAFEFYRFSSSPRAANNIGDCPCVEPFNLLVTPMTPQRIWLGKAGIKTGISYGR